MEEYVKKEGRVQLKQAVGKTQGQLVTAILNVVNSTEDQYLTAHGSNDAMRQCARRFKRSNAPDFGKPTAIKVRPGDLFQVYYY